MAQKSQYCEAAIPMIRIKKILKAILTALVLVILSAISVSAAEPIKIGVSLGLTGRYSEISHLQERSFRLWERHINKKGGILGRKINIIIYDDKSDPETAKAAYEYLITKDKVDLLFAPYSSELTEAVLPVTELYHYPLIASGASADRLWQKGYKYFFGLYSVASRYTAGFLELIVQNGFKNVSIIRGEDTFSANIAEGTRQLAQKFGLNVVSYLEFGKGTANFDPLVRKIKDSNVQVLVVCGYFDEAVKVRLALKRIGWYPKVYYASVGPALQDYYEQLGSDAEHTFSSSQWERHGRLPGSEDFYKEFTNYYRVAPSYHAANAYAAGQILEMAIKKAQSLDREKIRNILFSMNTISIIGRYGVDRTGRQIKHFPLIIQWQKGKKEIVWPQDLRTAKPVFK